MKVTRKDILFLSISVFVVTTIWIASNLYHAWATSTISQDLQLQIIPITPNFDTTELDKLKLRQKVTPLSEISLFGKGPLGSPTPTLEVPVSSSSSGMPITIQGQ